jgi:hypothetical protein
MILAIGKSAIVAGLALALFGGFAAAGAAAPPSCAEALAKLQGNAPDPAAAAQIYRQIQPQTLPCVRSGRTAADSLLQAKAFAALGFRFRDRADDAIVKAIEAEPTVTVPSDLNPGTSGVKVAETLDRDGFHDEARQTLLKVIEDYPTTPLTSRDKAILRPNRPFSSQLIAVVTDSRTVETVAAVVVVVMGVFWWRRRRLYFQPFTGNDAVAADLRSMIRSELHRLAEESARADGTRRLRIDQAGPYEDQVDLGIVAEGLPGGDLVKGLVSLLKLVGTRSRLVTGHAFPTPKVHLALEKVRSRKMANHTEIDADDLDFPVTGTAEHSVLALPSAVWIILTHYKGETLGGTTDWRSYIDFAAGYAWQRKWETEGGFQNLRRARDCYLRACQDPANTAAAINLTRLDQWAEGTAGARRRDTASRIRLERALRATQKTPGSLQWYRARYLLSADMRDGVESARDSAGLSGTVAGPDDATVAREARDYAIELVARLADRSSAKLLPEEFLAKARPAALTLLARQAFPSSADPATWIVSQRPDAPITPETIGQELQNLRAHGPRPGTAERLVEFVRDNFKLEDQAHYNLLRYHGTRVRILATSIERWQERLATYQGRDPEWTEEVQFWMDDLEDLCQNELQQLREHDAQIDDKFLRERVEEFRPPARTAREPWSGRHREGPRPAGPPPLEPPRRDTTAAERFADQDFPDDPDFRPTLR